MDICKQPVVSVSQASLIISETSDLLELSALNHLKGLQGII